MNRLVSLVVLETHRDNLAKAKTFEEFRDDQVRFVDYLIAREKADQAEIADAEEFVNKSFISNGGGSNES